MIDTVKAKISEIATQIQQADDYELRVGYVVYRWDEVPVSCNVNRVGCNQEHINYRFLSIRWLQVRWCAGQLQCGQAWPWSYAAAKHVLNPHLSKNFVIFTLSVPICTPLNTYFHILVLAAPIRRGKMPSKLHQETRKAQETQRCIPEHNSRDKKSKSTEKSKRVWFCSAIRCVFAGNWQLVLISSIS